MSSAARGEPGAGARTGPSLDTGDSTRPYNRPLRGDRAGWVHVITPDGTTGNVSQALIDDQIDVLNNTFEGGEGGFNTGFSFTLAGVTGPSNADWYFANPGGKERAMKRALYVPGNNVLNMYLTTAGDYLGWAYLPKVVTQGNAFLDGVVIDWESLRGASATLSRQVRPGRDRDARGRPLAQPRAHVLPRLQRPGRLRGRHAVRGDADFRLPRRQGHVHRRRGSTRSTTTWTTRTTSATRSSRPARPPACRTPG